MLLAINMPTKSHFFIILYVVWRHHRFLLVEQWSLLRRLLHVDILREVVIGLRLEHLLEKALSLDKLGRSLRLELLNTLVSFHSSVHLVFDVRVVQLRFLHHVWRVLLLAPLLFILFGIFRFFNGFLLFLKLFL